MVIREGYMHKEGHVRKSWKLRLFQLTSSGNLRYYGDEEKPPIDSIPLGGCTISEPKSKRSGHPHAFRLDLDRTSGDKAKYVLSAADLDETTAWREAILQFAENASETSLERRRILDEETDRALGCGRSRQCMG